MEFTRPAETLTDAVMRLAVETIRQVCDQPDEPEPLVCEASLYDSGPAAIGIYDEEHQATVVIVDQDMLPLSKLISVLEQVRSHCTVAGRLR